MGWTPLLLRGSASRSAGGRCAPPDPLAGLCGPSAHGPDQGSALDPARRFARALHALPDDDCVVQGFAGGFVVFAAGLFVAVGDFPGPLGDVVRALDGDADGAVAVGDDHVAGADVGAADGDGDVEAVHLQAAGADAAGDL